VKYEFSSRLKMTAMGGSLAVLLVAVGGCVASGYGGDSYYDDGGGVIGYGGVDVYDGPAYGYGGWGWGRGYRVGPPHGGFDRNHPDHGRPPGAHGAAPQRPYHSPPPSHSMPSIPSRPRGGGGGRSGGGHPGGGGHRS
jgi:hypothetical protein